MSYCSHRLAVTFTAFSVVAITIAASASSPAHAQGRAASNGPVWSKAGWDISAIKGTTTSLPACLALRTFVSRHDPGKSAAWGFFHLTNGKWFLAIDGSGTSAMVGKPVKITVDGTLIHGTTPIRTKGWGTVTHFGELTEASIKAIAGGHVLRVTLANDLLGLSAISFSLRGSDNALAATRECIATLREIVAQETAASRQRQPSAPMPTPSSSPSASRYRIRDSSPDAFLNLRTGPSTEFPIRAVIPQGATVEITGSCGAIASRAVWCPVRWGSITGWAHGGGLVEAPMEAPHQPPQGQASAEPPLPKKTQDDSKARTTVSTGTGFYVSAAGHVLSNAHVVDRCRHLRVAANGSSRMQPARVLARDRTNDLALIKLEEAPTHDVSLLTWRRDVKLGESISAFGFPHADILASTGTFTKGDVTALAGVGNDFTQFQLSAPLQSGNSGGPVVDAHGNVVGVAVAKLNALVIAKESGDLPQNVNFAVKASHATSFLDAHGITMSPAPAGLEALSGHEIAERLRKTSVLIVCVSSKDRAAAASQ